MLRLIEFDEDLDLSFFYEQCKKEGLKNNSSQDRIWDNFKSYDKHMTWILYNDELLTKSPRDPAYTSATVPLNYYFYKLTNTYNDIYVAIKYFDSKFTIHY